MDAQAVADKVCDAMFADDAASRMLGLQIPHYQASFEGWRASLRDIDHWATVRVEPNNSVERTPVGKARRVVDQRKK